MRLSNKMQYQISKNFILGARKRFSGELHKAFSKRQMFLCQNHTLFSFTFLYNIISINQPFLLTILHKYKMYEEELSVLEAELKYSVLNTNKKAEVEKRKEELKQLINH